MYLVSFRENDRTNISPYRFPFPGHQLESMMFPAEDPWTVHGIWFISFFWRVNWWTFSSMLMMDVKRPGKILTYHIWENYHHLTRSYCKWCMNIGRKASNSSTSGTFGGAVVRVPFIDTKTQQLGGGFNYFWNFHPTWGNDPVWLAYSSNSLKKQQLELDNKLTNCWSPRFFYKMSLLDGSPLQ